jgi:succinyl-diaminopimelate desuccinylase
MGDRENLERARRAIDAAVDTRQEDLVETLRELVRIPTETPPGRNYDTIVDLLLPRFAAIGFDAQRYDIPDEVFEDRCRRYYPEMLGVRANLLARATGETERAMLWYTHLDTQPAGDLGEWSADPFDPVVKDGYVWGRGTADSKGGAAAILTAFTVLRELGIAPRVSPVVALTTDEEIGPYTGLMYMADQGVFDRCEWFHSCDGFADAACIGSLGSFIWKITVRGTRAHSASSQLGVNAIEHSVALLEELLRLKEEVITRRSALRSPESETGVSHLAPVLNITVAHGGIKHNAVPSEFKVEGDRRYLPEETQEECVHEIEQAMRRAIARDSKLDCALEILPFYESFARDPEDEWVQTMRGLISDVRGVAVQAAGIQGSSDVAYVANITRMSIVANGLARLPETHNHAADERCRVSDLLSLAKIVAMGAAGLYRGRQ